ncbi:hypothetical protein GEMRC1_009331 [Eukaryota sp. GEM-RC1]
MQTISSTGPSFDPSTFKEPRSGLDYSHGTTTLGFVFQGGFSICQKVLEINPYLLGTMAGGAADCAFWERVLSQRCRLWELEHGERVTVSAASKMLSNMLYQYKGYGLSVGTMVAGFDHSGPGLFYVDSEGQRIRGNLFAVGSGSTYAYGILDSEYKFDMTEAEAVELGRRAITHAVHRDSYSGGFNRCYIVRHDGWEQMPVMDTHELFTGEKEP